MVPLLLGAEPPRQLCPPELVKSSVAPDPHLCRVLVGLPRMCAALLLPAVSQPLRVHDLVLHVPLPVVAMTVVVGRVLLRVSVQERPLRLKPVRHGTVMALLPRLLRPMASYVFTQVVGGGFVRHSGRVVGGHQQPLGDVLRQFWAPLGLRASWVVKSQAEAPSLLVGHLPLILYVVALFVVGAPLGETAA